MTSVSTDGKHTCALVTTGDLMGWGQNLSGQLGDGTNPDGSTPVDVTSLVSG